MKKAKIGIAIGAAVIVVAGGVISIGVSGILNPSAKYDFTVDYENIEIAETIKDVAVHDPSIIEENGIY